MAGPEGQVYWEVAASLKQQSAFGNRDQQSSIQHSAVGIQPNLCASQVLPTEAKIDSLSLKSSLD
jgi:hypothetical protein